MVLEWAVAASSRRFQSSSVTAASKQLHDLDGPSGVLRVMPAHTVRAYALGEKRVKQG